ncbi:MAG TPA: hypothetical protein VMK66_20925 [Myxococcales bacterium]|nr:hypothetical protein [Myxococcales bacterium]
MADASPSPESSFRSLRRSLSHAVFEVALVVLGVVLGLAVNNWREAAQQRGRTEDMRREFAEEIRANRDELASEGVAPLHRKLAEAWTRLATLPAPRPADRDAAWSVASTGMHPFQPRDAVWTAFARGELMERMPSREVLQLAEIYRAQEGLRELNRSLYAAVVVPTSESETPRFIRSQANVIRLTLIDITSAESRLLDLYQHALR